MGIFSSNQQPERIEDTPQILFRVTLVVSVPTDRLGQPAIGSADRYLWARDAMGAIEAALALPPGTLKTDEGRHVDIMSVAAVNPTGVSADLVLNKLEEKSIIN